MWASGFESSEDDYFHMVGLPQAVAAKHGVGVLQLHGAASHTEPSYEQPPEEFFRSMFLGLIENIVIGMD